MVWSKRHLSVQATQYVGHILDNKCGNWGWCTSLQCISLAYLAWLGHTSLRHGHMLRFFRVAFCRLPARRVRLAENAAERIDPRLLQEAAQLRDGIRLLRGRRAGVSGLGAWGWAQGWGRADFFGIPKEEAPWKERPTNSYNTRANCVLLSCC